MNTQDLLTVCDVWQAMRPDSQTVTTLALSQGIDLSMVETDVLRQVYSHVRIMIGTLIEQPDLEELLRSIEEVIDVGFAYE